MCTHQKLIFNKRLRRPLYVKCGKCKACQQEKAAKRVKRIKDTYLDGYLCLMVTLTYSRGKVPYVFRDDAYKFCHGELDALNVYRDCSVRKVRCKTPENDYGTIYKWSYNQTILDTIEFVQDSTLLNTKDLKYENGKIGVCYYQDYQHFIARLRLNLKRLYNYDGKFFVYACSEYGSKSNRPHFHLLFFIEESAEKIIRDAIIESWPFSNLRRFERAIERSYKAASYVASYVNQSDNFPLFFRDYFKQKHSYSKGFGLNNKAYSISKILEKFERGSLSISTLHTEKGYNRVVDVPFPSYVINRYFPKFKGYTTCPPGSLLSYMQRICSGNWDTIIYDQDLKHFPPKHVYGLVHENLYLGHEDLLHIQTRLLNAYKRFVVESPIGYDTTFDGYLQLHINIWNLYNSTILKLHLLNPDIPLWEKYDNLDSLNNNARMRAVLGLYDMHFDVTDPNEFESTKLNSSRFEESFNTHVKHKCVSNAIYLLDEDCEL